MAMSPSPQSSRLRNTYPAGETEQATLMIRQRPKVGKGLCGARTRQGRPCVRGVVEGNARCRNHGGCSTGPTSAEGKRKVTLNLPKVRKAQDPAS